MTNFSPSLDDALSQIYVFIHKYWFFFLLVELLSVYFNYHLRPPTFFPVMNKIEQIAVEKKREELDVKMNKDWKRQSLFINNYTGDSRNLLFLKIRYQWEYTAYNWKPLPFNLGDEFSSFMRDSLCNYLLMSKNN